MAYTYRIRKSTVQDEEGNRYTVYGIEAISSEGEVLSGFSDVFFDRQRAEGFVRLCNTGGLALIHCPDAVEDALADQSVWHPLAASYAASS